MSDLISIITPVYNAEKFLHRTAQCIHAQGIENWEWLLVDDGSTDGSAKLCDELAAGDSRIKTFHQSNGGPAKAKNLALKYAQGKYVTFLDADDTLEPDTLKMNLELFTRYPDLEIVRFPICSVSSAGKYPFHNVSSVEILNGNREIFRLWCCNLQKITGFMWGKIFLRKTVEGIEVPNMRNSEDICFVNKVIDRCESIAFSPFGQYGYYVNDNSICHQKQFADGARNDLIANMEILKTARKRENFSYEYTRYFCTAVLIFASIVRTHGIAVYEKEIAEFNLLIPTWSEILRFHGKMKSRLKLFAIRLLGWRKFLVLMMKICKK